MKVWAEVDPPNPAPKRGPPNRLWFPVTNGEYEIMSALESALFKPTSSKWGSTRPLELPCRLKRVSV
jgi:hypothetical protein